MRSLTEETKPEFICLQWKISFNLYQGGFQLWRLVLSSDVFQFTIISLEATSEILIPVVLADMAIFSKAKPFKILRVKISRWVADSSIPEKLI